VRSGRLAAWRAGGAVAVHEIADAHVVDAVAGEEQPGRAGRSVLQQVSLEHRQ
jgi:hypothetical protein